MQTRVTEMFGIEFPIFAFSHCRDVVAAVTNAGGFGVLGAVAHSPERLDIDLAWIDEQTRGKPYGVDLLLPTKYVSTGEAGGPDRETVRQLLPPEQQEFVDDILRRYDVPALPDQVEQSAGRLTIATRWCRRPAGRGVRPSDSFGRQRPRRASSRPHRAGPRRRSGGGRAGGEA